MWEFDDEDKPSLSELIYFRWENIGRFTTVNLDNKRGLSHNVPMLNATKAKNDKRRICIESVVERLV